MHGGLPLVTMSPGSWEFEDRVAEQPGNSDDCHYKACPSYNPVTVEPGAPGLLCPKWHVWGLNTHNYNCSDRSSKAPD